MSIVQRPLNSRRAGRPTPSTDLAAILTPPDAISQMLLAGPLLLLYVLSIGVAYVFGKKEEEGEGTAVEETDE